MHLLLQVVDRFLELLLEYFGPRGLEGAEIPGSDRRVCGDPGASEGARGRAIGRRGRRHPEPLVGGALGRLGCGVEDR